MVTILKEKTTAKPEFAVTLFQRVNDFFQENQIQKKADSTMIIKVIGGLMAWAFTYTLLYSFNAPYWQFMLLYILHGATHLFIMLNICHDANHGAITNQPQLNILLRYCFDLVGLNSYMWRVLHHTGHHYCINIQEEDETFVVRGLFRLSPDAPKKAFHRYQHIYTFILYAFLTFDWILTKDFESFFINDHKCIKKANPPFKEYVKLFIFKIFYFTYMLVLPTLILPFSFWQVFLAFFIMHLIIGFWGALVLQIVHPLPNAQYPKSNQDYPHFIYHVFATTADYAGNSTFAKFFFGGLHLHVIHHLFPHICHSHYPQLTEIVKTTAKEYGVEYRQNPTMFQAVREHYILLKQLAK